MAGYLYILHIVMYIKIDAALISPGLGIGYGKPSLRDRDGGWTLNISIVNSQYFSTPSNFELYIRPKIRVSRKIIIDVCIPTHVNPAA